MHFGVNEMKWAFRILAQLSFLVNFMWCWWSLVWFSSLRVASARLFLFPIHSLFFLLLLSSFCMNCSALLSIWELRFHWKLYLLAFEALAKINVFFYSDKSTLRCQTISNMHTENKCYVQELSFDKRKNLFVSKGPTLVKSIRIWAHFLDHSTKIYSVFVYLFQLANRLLCK